MAEIIAKLNDLFGADTTDNDQLNWVMVTIKAKLLESPTLGPQAKNNTKEQFSASPDLRHELQNAVMASLDAHTSLSAKALNDPKIMNSLMDILLQHARLWETLRGEKAA